MIPRSSAVWSFVSTELEFFPSAATEIEISKHLIQKQDSGGIRCRH